MGVLEAIGGLFSSAASGIADLAGKAWQGVKSVFIFAATVFDLVGAAWDWMVNGLSWIGDNLIGLAARVLHTLEWVTLHMIPRAVAWAIGKAVRWAQGAIATVEHFILSTITSIVRWFKGAIATLKSWVDAAFRAVWHPLRDLWNWLQRVGRRLESLVLHPDRLVAWILGALVLPLVKWMIQRSSPLIVWLFKRAVSLLPALAHTLEDALSKLI